MRTTKLLLAGICTAAVGIGFSTGAARADEMDDLKAQVKALKAALETVQKRQEQLERKQAAQPAAAPAPVYPTKAAAAIPPAHPGCMPIPGTATCIQIGGYIKVNAATDVKGHMDGTASFVPDTALNGTQLARRNPDFFMDAKESRFNITTFTPTGWGDLKTFLEVDFYGAGGNTGNPWWSSSYDPRLRQAYFSVGPWLFGQTWSTFMDLDTYPDTLDFGGPTGLAFNRQAVARYTTPLGPGNLSLAVENSFGDFEGSTNISNYSGGFLPSLTVWDKAPDVAAKWSVDPSWGHFAVAAIGRWITADGPFTFGDSGPCTGGCSFTGSASTVGWGVLGGLGVKMFKSDLFTIQAAGGDGIGRYLYGADDANEGAGIVGTPGNYSLRATPSFGGAVGYLHHWNDWIRSTVAFSMAHYDHEDPLDPGNSYKNIDAVHANLIFDPPSIPGVEFGIEYIYSRIQMDGVLPVGAAFVGNGVAAVPGQGSSGTADRILATAKASF